MATTMKVTMTLPVESAEAIRRLVADGKADSVGGFVQRAVQVSPRGSDDRPGTAAGRPSAGRVRFGRNRGANLGVTLNAGPLTALGQADRRCSFSSLGPPGPERPSLPRALRPPMQFATLHVRPARPAASRASNARAPLGRVDATDVGWLVAASGTSDLADAHVAICARRSGTGVVISEPDDLRTFDPSLAVTVI